MNSLDTPSLLQQSSIHPNNRYNISKPQQLQTSKDKSHSNSNSHYKFTRRFTQVINPKGKLKEFEKQQQIDRQNAILFSKLTTIMNKPHISNSMTIQKFKQKKIMFVEAKQPNTQQNSIYSYQKFQDEWKERKVHSKLASKMIRQNRSKHSIGKQFESVEQGENKRNFDDILRFFDNLGLGQKEEGKEREKEFDEPENIAERIIICRKACVIDEISYLIEISTAYKRVFILAFNMMNARSKTLRKRMSEEKARTIFLQYDYDFDQILNNLTIQGNRISIKIPLRNPTLSAQKHSLDPTVKQTIAYEKQTKFIKRNYYDAVEKIKKNSSSKDPHTKDAQPVEKNDEDIRRRFCSLTITHPENDKETQQTVFKHYRNQIDLRNKGFSIGVNLKKKREMQNDKKMAINKTENNVEENGGDSLGLVYSNNKKRRNNNLSFDTKEKTTKHSSEVFKEIPKEDKKLKIKSIVQSNKNNKNSSSNDIQKNIDSNKKINLQNRDSNKQLSSQKQLIDSSDQKKEEPLTPKSVSQHQFNNYNDDFDEQDFVEKVEDKKNSSKEKDEIEEDYFGGEYDQFQEEQIKQEQQSQKQEIINKLSDNIQEEYIDDFQQV